MNQYKNNNPFSMNIVSPGFSMEIEAGKIIDLDQFGIEFTEEQEKSYDTVGLVKVKAVKETPKPVETPAIVPVTEPIEIKAETQDGLTNSSPSIPETQEVPKPVKTKFDFKNKSNKK